MTDIVIIGGGLAGLVNSILLSRKGLEVTLVERKTYPFHRVCGEYISNETLPFLERNDLFPTELEPSSLEVLQISSTSGRSFSAPLDLGGFGVSRYQYDHWLSKKARASGVRLLEGTTASDIRFDDDHFRIRLNSGEELQANYVIGAYGKRSKLDKHLDRPSSNGRYPYVAVKYHARTDMDDDLIALHNFQGGYCGISKVEGDIFNICYLIHRDQVKQHKNIGETEKNVLFKNPFLADAFQNSEFLFEKPEVINEISFDKKEPIYGHVLMSGDSAGMITPLCGNGMAMAIQSAAVLSDILLRNWNNGSTNRGAIEGEYSKEWEKLFERRLWVGRKIQSAFFGQPFASELAVMTGKYIKPMTRSLIKLSHGQPFE